MPTAPGAASGPQSSLDRVHAALEEAGCRPKKRARDFMACCPVHGDRTASLHVTWTQSDGAGRVLLRCHGCEAPVADIAEALGLGVQDLFDEPLQVSSPRRWTTSAPPRRPANRLGRLPKPLVTKASREELHPGKRHQWQEVATYDYVGDGAELVQQVVRRECTVGGERHKEFVQRFTTHDGHLVDRKPAGFEPVLYRLPEVLAAVHAGQPVWLLEGEKDVATAEHDDLVATTNAGGSKSLTEQLLTPLNGATVHVVLDRDAAGWARGVTAVQLLSELGCTVRLLLPAPTAAKADYTDHREAGLGPEDLLEVHVDEVATWHALSAVEVRLAALQTTEVEVEAQLAAHAERAKRVPKTAETHQLHARRWVAEAEIRFQRLQDAVRDVVQLATAAGTTWATQAADVATSALRQGTITARSAHDAAGVTQPSTLSAVPVPHEQPSTETTASPGRHLQVVDSAQESSEETSEEGRAEQPRRGGGGGGGGGRTSSGVAIMRDRYEVVDGVICKITMKQDRRTEEWVESYKAVLTLDVTIARVEYVDEVADDELAPLQGRESRTAHLRTGNHRRATHVVFAFKDPLDGEVRQQRVEFDRAVDSTWLLDLDVAGVQFDSRPAGRAQVWDAIRHVSGTWDTVTLHRATGWRDTPEHGWGFVHSGGIITAKGNQPAPVLLTGALARYDLPDPTTDAARLREAFLQDSAGLLQLLPDRVAVPMLGTAYRAAISPNPWVVVAVGSKGSGKTGIAALTMHHFGEAWDRNRPGMSMSGNGDTLNALRIKLANAKDAVFFLDDVAPTHGWTKAQVLLEEVTRMLSNQEAKDRATRDGQATTTGTGPRTSGLISSEVMPRPGSGADRMLPIPVQASDYDLRELIELDAAKARYGRALVMASFMQWLARDLPGHRQQLRVEVAAEAQRRRDTGAPTRLADQLAQLWGGWLLMLQFLTDVEALTVAEREELLLRVAGGLHAAGEASVDPDLPMRTGARVVELLNHALSQQLAHVVDADTGDAPAGTLATRLGWKRINLGVPDEVTGLPRYRFETRAPQLGYVVPRPYPGGSGEAELLMDSNALEAALKAACLTLADAPQMDRGTALRALLEEGVLVTDRTKRFTLERKLRCLTDEDGRPVRRRMVVLRLNRILGDCGPDDLHPRPAHPEGPDGPAGGRGAGTAPDLGPAATSGGAPQSLFLDDDATSAESSSPVSDLGAAAEGSASSSPLAGRSVAAQDVTQEPWSGLPGGPTATATEQEAAMHLSDTTFRDLDGHEVRPRIDDVDLCLGCGAPSEWLFEGLSYHPEHWSATTAAQRELQSQRVMGWMLAHPERYEEKLQAAVTPATPVGAAQPQPAAPRTARSSTSAPATSNPTGPKTTKPATTRTRRQAVPAHAFTAAVAVVDVDVVWLPDGSTRPLPRPIRHLGDLEELGRELNLGTPPMKWRREPESGQVVPTDALWQQLGVDVSKVPVYDEQRRAWLKEISKDLSALTGAQDEGWVFGRGDTAPQIRGLIRLRRKDAERGSIAIVCLPVLDPSLTALRRGEPVQVARRLQLFADAVGIPFRGAISTGMDLLDLVLPLEKKQMWTPVDYDGVGPAHSGLLDAAFNWTRKPEREERDQRFVHAFDRNGSYLTACSEVLLGLGAPAHQGPGVQFDRARAGWWKIVVPAAQDRRWPNILDPEGRAVGTEQWVTSASMKYAIEHQDLTPEILEAWLWPAERSSRLLEPWYRLLRDARTQLLASSDPEARQALALVKLIYTRSNGWFASPNAKTQREFQPYWHHAIRAQAKVGMLHTVMNLGAQSGVWPLVVADTDVLGFASNDVHPRAAWPGRDIGKMKLGSKLGTQLGGFKPYRSGPMSDQLAHLTGRGWGGRDALVAIDEWPTDAALELTDTPPGEHTSSTAEAEEVDHQ